MTRQHIAAESVAEAYLALLKARGVDYLFANAGTDFAPIVEALARAGGGGLAMPAPVIAAHETVAVSMAHGYAMVSERVPAVMVHVSVGTANALCGIMNAARENVPILMTAGRSPLNETGVHGARDAYIHWAQEMYDQAGMARELVKWEYELRNAEQLETVVDRALALAQSEPSGPVYLTLPRETLAARLDGFEHDAPSRHAAAAPPAADPGAIAEAAAILGAAENPLIVTANAGRDRSAVAALAGLAERFAIPVVQHKPRYLSLPSDHAMHFGYEPGPLVRAADAILVLESDVPWIPTQAAPPEHCRVVHCGVDPLFSRYPIRGFPADVAITAKAGGALAALTASLGRTADAGRVEARRKRLAAERAELLRRREAVVREAATSRPLHPAWVGHCIGAAKDEDAIVINEYTLALEHCPLTLPGSFFGSSAASGLGWGFGAALGAKLAAPDRLVVAVLGDGSYMFANPVSAHHAATAHGLPVLVVVVNNAMWGAVKRATTGMYPAGHAARSNHPAFIHLDDLPAFDQICTASGGYGERVEDPAALPDALRRALRAIKVEKRHALLNVICRPPE